MAGSLKENQALTMRELLEMDANRVAIHLKQIVPKQAVKRESWKPTFQRKAYGEKGLASFRSVSPVSFLSDSQERTPEKRVREAAEIPCGSMSSASSSLNLPSNVKLEEAASSGSHNKRGFARRILKRRKLAPR